MEQTARRKGALAVPAGDPLWNLLITRWKLPLPAILVMVVAVGAILVFGLGAVVSYRVHPRADIVRVFDPGHLQYALLVQFVYTPLVWVMYLWQPLGIAGTLDSLRQADVIVETQDQSVEAFTRRMNRVLSGSRVFVAVVLTLLLVLVLETFVVIPQEALGRGQPFFWFYDKRFYLVVFVPILYLTAYVTIVVVLKGILALAWFYRLFRTFPARVHPLHPDGVGGFGALGSLAIKYGLIAVALGVVGTTLTLSRLLAGTGQLYLDSVLFYASYVVLTPLTLVVPLWSAHQAMVSVRNEMLRDLSGGFDKALEGMDSQQRGGGSSEMAWEHAAELRVRHKFVSETYPTWPLSLAGFRRFAIAAALPLITSAASIMIDIVTA